MTSSIAYAGINHVLRTIAIMITVIAFADQTDAQQHDSASATTQFEVHPDLKVELYAAEPMMANPSNIDVDHLGRVWVCEVINYRHFRNTDAKPREEGDRILILEDTDNDNIADKSTVFYQGRDIDSAHGICVLGNRAIVSANDSVFLLIDDDGDLKADRKELLFTGIGGTQHDHGIHAFVFGPDGKLYFNFGNEGKQICDKNGNPIVDAAGNKVEATNKPYNQGMVFRCNLDGSEFETLAWNFRNNWEVCVDSFGRMWQSDNDDDGNKSTRINFVMPFGNYGYKDQKTGAGWRVSRTNMHSEIPKRHWHQNDPGVIPNMLETGAGSPTGICVYEGDQLSTVFQNQIIHCDAGPSVVRSYPVQNHGAGYSAEIVNIMDGSELNQWFRPSDVCVAPDGSLIVADWYDPGVGGHRMQDVERGRLFRVSSATGVHAKPTTPDFSTPASAVAALKSPNLATRYLAWDAIGKFGESALPELEKLWKSSNPRYKARALWRIGKLEIAKGEKLDFIMAGLSDENPELRCCAIRLCVQLRNEIELSDIAEAINLNDPSPAVVREILLGIRQWRTEDSPQAWSTLASKLTSGDRWLLEAIGIAADGNWNKYLEVLLQQNPELANSAAGRDIIWRSRGDKTAALLKDIVSADDTNESEIGRYFRAYDLLPAQTNETMTIALRDLAFKDFGFEPEKAEAVLMEAVSRIEVDKLEPEEKKRLGEMVDLSRGTPGFIEMVDKFSSAEHYPELFNIVTKEADRQVAADAMRVLMNKKQMGFVHFAFIKATPETRVRIADALINCGNRKGEHVLAALAKRRGIDEEARLYAIQRLGNVESGCRDMIWWIDQKQDIDPLLMPYIKAALHKSSSEDVRERAQELFPIAQSKDEKPLPSITDLAKLDGSIENGAKVFAGNGTCAKCHRVAGKGIEVGPDLSEIGDKLTKLAMYESILFPSAGISHNYENWKVVTDDGKMITGVLVSESDAKIEIKDQEGIRHVIPVEQIDEKAKQKLSLMPDNLHQAMSSQELVDLVEYLVSLKK